MDGTHPLARAEDVTGKVLERVFHALHTQRVRLEGMLLKPNMIVPGKECPEQASVTAVATATLRVLRQYVPAAVPGIVFLSGGQDDRKATAHLNAMNIGAESRPWRVSFSYGRALQDPALEAWGAVLRAFKLVSKRSITGPAATALRVWVRTKSRWRAPSRPKWRLIGPAGPTTESRSMP